MNLASSAYDEYNTGSSPQVGALQIAIALVIKYLNSRHVDLLDSTGRKLLLMLQGLNIDICLEAFVKCEDVVQAFGKDELGIFKPKFLRRNANGDILSGPAEQNASLLNGAYRAVCVLHSTAVAEPQKEGTAPPGKPPKESFYKREHSLRKLFPPEPWFSPCAPLNEYFHLTQIKALEDEVLSDNEISNISLWLDKEKTGISMHR
ncbi:hypothetical protein JEQ12_012835 [Ovis aries]|uniref:Uncharacterized protein n=1 Tax=Ovis aries TaxID=9940 RepID=A0A836CR58_SHEEP|nr:hypothetical protein JEQ12_012835 [Ovis aries]